MYEVDKIKNTIIKGDSIQEMKKIPSNSIDLIFADPPYFMQTEGELLRTDGSKFAGVEDDWDKFSGYNEYDKFSFEWLKEAKRILKDDGAIWVIGSFQNIYRLGFIMQNLGYWILNDVIWSKPNAVPNFAGTRLQNSHETLLWCTKNEKAKYTFNYKTLKELNGNKQEKSVWDIGICIGNERLKGTDGKKVHSTQKPEALLYKIIIGTSKPGDIILDPFMGTGTTGAVAKRLGRNYIGIEREEKYIKAAEKRLENVIEEMDKYSDLSLEVKPPRVPVEKLLEKGYLEVGEVIYNKNKDVQVTIMENGHVSDGEETLSIHKMSAKHLNLTNNNGWDYYWVENQEFGFIKLDQLRYIYKENEKM